MLVLAGYLSAALVVMLLVHGAYTLHGAYTAGRYLGVARLPFAAPVLTFLGSLCLILLTRLSFGGFPRLLGALVVLLPAAHGIGLYLAAQRGRAVWLEREAELSRIGSDDTPAGRPAGYGDPAPPPEDR